MYSVTGIELSVGESIAVPGDRASVPEKRRVSLSLSHQILLSLSLSAAPAKSLPLLSQPNFTFSSIELVSLSSNIAALVESLHQSNLQRFPLQ